MKEYKLKITTKMEFDFEYVDIEEIKELSFAIRDKLDRIGWIEKSGGV